MAISVPESELEARRVRVLHIVTLSGLRAKGYLETSVAVHGGKCIVVPASDFEDEWTLDLAKNGHACIRDVLDDQRVVFVKVAVDPVLMRKSTRQFLPAGKVAYVPPAAAVSPVQSKQVVPVKDAVEEVEVQQEPVKSDGSKVGLGERFSVGEDALIVDLYSQGYGPNDIAKVFVSKNPGRSLGSVVSRYKRLRASGAIKPCQKSSKVQGNVEVKREVENKKQVGSKQVVNGVAWSMSEDDLLVSLWLKQPVLSIEKIVGEFQMVYPQRTRASLTNHIWRLQKAGKIKPRFVPRRGDAKAVQPLQSDESNKVTKTPVNPADFGNSFDPDGVLAKSETSILSEKSVDVSAGSVLVEASPYEPEVDRLYKMIVKLQADIADLQVKQQKDSSKLDEATEDVRVFGETICDCQRFGGELKDRVDGLDSRIVMHKHAVSGEAMLPMEAQT
jgi:hypothetical protein